MNKSLVNEVYNSDNEEPNIKTEAMEVGSSSGASTSSVVTLQTTSGTLLVTDINSVLKPGLSDIAKKSNRETMSYLKSKRILRHKNSEFENKKQKVE